VLRAANLIGMSCSSGSVCMEYLICIAGEGIKGLNWVE
jgi:hypothetical protein